MVEIKKIPVSENKKKKPSLGDKNPMRKIKIEKVTINIGTGTDEKNVNKAMALLSKFSDRKPVKCLAKKRIATFKIRPGMPIGAKITFRGEAGKSILLNLLKAKENVLKSSCFDENGFSFGITEYIDIPGIKYDMKIGMLGMDVCVTLTRPGFRIKSRKISSKVSRKHKILKEDAISFAEKELGVNIK